MANKKATHERGFHHSHKQFSSLEMAMTNQVVEYGRSLYIKHWIIFS
jgi:hypothetical protein